MTFQLLAAARSKHRHIDGRAVSVHLQTGYPVAQKTRRIYRSR